MLRIGFEFAQVELLYQKLSIGSSECYKPCVEGQRSVPTTKYVYIYIQSQSCTYPTLIELWTDVGCEDYETSGHYYLVIVPCALNPSFLLGLPCPLRDVPPKATSVWLYATSWHRDTKYKFYFYIPDNRWSPYLLTLLTSSFNDLKLARW